MTHAEMRTRSLTRLDELAGAPQSFTAAEVTAALNRGQRLFAAMTLCIERTGTLNLAAGQVWASLLGTFPRWFVPLRCSRRVIAGIATTAIWGQPLWGDPLWGEADAETVTGIVRVKPASLAALDALDPLWQTATGPGVLRYGVRGWDLAYHHPAPTVDAEIEYTYAAMPMALVADESVPEIPEEYHGSLIAYGVYELPAIKWGGEYLAKGMPLLQSFLEDAAKCAAYVRARSLAMRYDRAPMDLTAADRSRLVGRIAQVKDAREVAA